jgi:hypothetical protein
VNGWIAFAQSVTAQWLEKRDAERDAVGDLLAGALAGAVAAATEPKGGTSAPFTRTNQQAGSLSG